MLSVSIDLSLFREIQAWSPEIATVVRNKIEVEINFLSEFYRSFSSFWYDSNRLVIMYK